MMLLAFALSLLFIQLMAGNVRKPDTFFCAEAAKQLNQSIVAWN
jgi:hypothetical protein